MNTNQPLLFGLSLSIMIIATFSLLISTNREKHAFAKIFRRGKGIGELELRKFGCQNSRTNYMSLSTELHIFFIDPRLSPEQAHRLMSETFDPSLTECQIIKGRKHYTQGDLGKALYIPEIINQDEKYLSSSLLSLMLKTILEYGHSITNRMEMNKIDFLSYRDSLLSLFASKKMSREDYWVNFNLLLNDFRFLDKENFLLIRKKMVEFKGIFQEILNNKLVTAQDITRLCYSPENIIREIALTHPLSTQENKIIVSLINGAPQGDVV